MSATCQNYIGAYLPQEHACLSVPSFGNKSVLIVDQPENAGYIESVLRQHHFNIAGRAENGEQAMRQALARHPDLILMEIMLRSGGSGIHAACEIQKRERIPVIFMSECADSDMVSATKDANPYGYILKPFSSNDLLIAVKMAIYRRELEKKLSESERRFRVLFEQESDAIVVFDLGSHAIADVNDAMLRMYGYGREELIGHDLKMLMDQPYYDSLHRACTENASGAHFILLRQEHRKKDGTAVPVSCRGRIIEMNGKEQLFCSIRDSTDKIRQEEENALLQAQFLHSEKMASIGVLAAGIAHEINNPMAFISSNLLTMDKYLKHILKYVDFLSEQVARCADPGVSEQVRKRRDALQIDYVLQDSVDLVTESTSGAERVKKIVQDLKLFTRSDDAEPKLFNVHDCMENTINIIWNELKYKAMLEKDYGEVPAVRGYPQQLSQVFMNLLVNAAHAIEKQGVITISTWRDGPEVCVSISDTGCGIPEKNIKKIFEPFYTTKEVGKGSGLGLSIAYDIVTKKLCGTISVVSREGAGTTFTMRLPVELP